MIYGSYGKLECFECIKILTLFCQCMLVFVFIGDIWRWSASIWEGRHSDCDFTERTAGGFSSCSDSSNRETLQWCHWQVS